MKKNMITMVALLSNLLFYCCISVSVFLYLSGDSTLKCFLAIIGAVICMFGSSIPDIMIKVGVNGISNKLSRIGILIKFFCFIVCLILLDIETKAAIIVIIALSFLDIIVEVKLLIQIAAKQMDLKELINKVDELQEKTLDNQNNYFVLIFVSTCLFTYIHETNLECAVTLGVCICLHLFILEKIIKKMKIQVLKERLKIRLMLWMFEVIMLFFAFLKRSLFMCIVYVIYCSVMAKLTEKHRG